VILGQEVVTGTGHWLALGLPPGQVIGWDYRARDRVVHEHVRRVRDSGGLCVAAHPFAPYPCGTFGYSYSQFDAVEVWNGQWSSDVPWQADNETALAEWGRRLISEVESARWLPAVGGSDAHLTGQIAVPRTVVLADSLSVAEVLAGVRDGRAWIAGSSQVGLQVIASCGDAVAGLGQRLNTGGADAVIRVEVSGVPDGAVTLHTDRGIAHRADLAPTGHHDEGMDNHRHRVRLRPGRGPPSRPADGCTDQSHHPVLTRARPGRRPSSRRTAPHRQELVEGWGPPEQCQRARLR